MLADIVVLLVSAGSWRKSRKGKENLSVHHFVSHVLSYTAPWRMSVPRLSLRIRPVRFFSLFLATLDTVHCRSMLREVKSNRSPPAAWAQHCSCPSAAAQPHARGPGVPSQAGGCSCYCPLCRFSQYQDTWTLTWPATKAALVNSTHTWDSRGDSHRRLSPQPALCQVEAGVHQFRSEELCPSCTQMAWGPWSHLTSCKVHPSSVNEGWGAGSSSACPFWDRGPPPGDGLLAYMPCVR